MMGGEEGHVPKMPLAMFMGMIMFFEISWLSFITNNKAHAALYEKQVRTYLEMLGGS